MAYLERHPFVIKINSKNFFNSNPTFEEIIDLLKEKDQELWASLEGVSLETLRNQYDEVQESIQACSKEISQENETKAEAKGPQEPS